MRSSEPNTAAPYGSTIASFDAGALLEISFALTLTHSFSISHFYLPLRMNL